MTLGWPILTNKPLWSCSIVGLMQGPASKLWRAVFLYLFLLIAPFYAPVQPTIDPKGRKGNIAIPHSNSMLKIEFFFFGYKS